MLKLLALFVTLVGHLGLWVAAYNQMNALKIPHGLKKVVEKFMLVGILALAVAFTAVRYPIGWLEGLSVIGVAASALGGYALVCWMFAGYVSLRGLWWTFTLGRPEAHLKESGERHDLRIRLGRTPSSDFVTSRCAALPGNQLFQLEVTRKELEVPTLPASMDGLKIAHLSDIHLTGRIDQDYYQAIVDETNKLEADAVVITGDIVDKAQCLGWIDPILGSLNSRLGTFYILGNHDRRLGDEKGLRKRLKNAGLKCVNGTWASVKYRQGRLWFCGNELPWFEGAERVKSEPQDFDATRDVRIALCHSPDQISWAKKRRIPLMLAGHTHGGQIRLPIVGPIVSPSKYGVKYASGVFHTGPTLMHVSRGISGVHPLRWNCLPELSLLTLRSSNAAQSDRHADTESSEKTDDTAHSEDTPEAKTAKATGAA